MVLAPDKMINDTTPVNKSDVPIEAWETSVLNPSHSLRSYQGSGNLIQAVEDILQGVTGLYEGEGVHTGDFDVRVLMSRLNRIPERLYNVNGNWSMPNTLTLIVNPFGVKNPGSELATAVKRFDSVSRNVGEKSKKAFEELYENGWSAENNKALMSAQDYRKCPKYVEAFLALANAYMNDWNVERWIIRPTVVHETSHKILAQQGGFDSLYPMYERLESKVQQVFDSARGSTPLSADIFSTTSSAGMNYYCREVFERTARLLAERFSPSAAEDYKFLIKARGLNEALARVVSVKLTGSARQLPGKKGGGELLEGYMLKHTDITGDIFDRLIDYLRRHSYIDILRMREQAVGYFTK